MHDALFDAVVVSEIGVDLLQLFLLLVLDSLEVLLVFYRVQEVGDLSIFSLHLILSVSSHFDDVFHLHLGEYALL